MADKACLLTQSYGAPNICGMRTDDAIRHFGSQAALARALDIKPPSISSWGAEVPPLRQLQIEKLTGGKLRANPAILPAGPAEAATI